MFPAALRPRDAAAYLSISYSSFWRYAKNDPSFPKPVKVGPNITLVMRKDLDAWLDKAAAKAEGK